MSNRQVQPLPWSEVNLAAAQARRLAPQGNGFDLTKLALGSCA